MEPDFWHQKWQANQIGFHAHEVNPLLVAHLKELALAKNARVFIPLCGKTRDIAWLLSKGYRVVGAELSELAITQLFAELGVQPAVSVSGNLKHYSAQNIDIFGGNIFDLTGDQIGEIDAVYDRAALVALPGEMRAQYAAHITKLSAKSPQLLICYDYDQSMMAGPPFSVKNEEIGQLYGDAYTLTLQSSKDLPGGLKGQCAAMENVWVMR